MKKIVGRMIVVLIAAAVLIWGVGLAKCEMLTRKYYLEFEYACRDNPMLGDMEYFKVLDCDGTKARVYHVAAGRTAGDLLEFEKIQGKWVETGWKTVWSASGSASDVVWPYWWHFVYGGV